jgi:putative addiction module component (TIGR02574 family)
MMPMTVEQIEAEAMKLPEQARAELLGRLMRSLADASAMDQEVAEAWAQEAVRRDEEMESGSVAGIPAEEVFEELRNKGK